MKTTASPVASRILRPSALVVALASAFAAPQAFAQLPRVPSVTQGGARITQPTASQMTVLQTTRSAIINWQSFSIGKGASVAFSQPDAQSVALNRVVGNDPSAILGSLSANGRVFIVNPNGVLFGAGASVNVGGLVASTLGIADSDFITGHYAFTRGTAPAAGVVNDASLQAAPGGVLALVGSSVENHGTMNAPAGTAALAAGRTVTLDFQGDGLTQLRVSEADLQALSSNTGTMTADGGRVLLLADATQATGLVVNQAGIVRARSLVQGPGGVVIAGGGGDVAIAGSVDTQGDAGLHGGDVAVSGRNVSLLAGGHIDANGDAGGGHVALTASAVGGNGGAFDVESGAQVSADARTQGNGGEIDLGGTSGKAQGSFSTRGGAQSGDGGLVNLAVAGSAGTGGMRVDAGSSHGRAGAFDLAAGDVLIYDGATGGGVDTALLDAMLDQGLNVHVTSTAGAIQFGFNNGDGLVIPANIVRSTGDAHLGMLFDSDQGIATAAPTSIRSLSGPLDVLFSTDRSASLGSPITLSGMSILTDGGSVAMFRGLDPSQGVSGRVTLSGVTVDTRVDQSSTNDSGSIAIAAEGIVVDQGSRLSTSTGALSLTGLDPRESGVGVDIDASTLETTQGALTLTGLGEQHGVQVQDGSTVSAQGGAIGLTGGLHAGDFNFSGDVSISGSSVTNTGTGSVAMTGIGRVNGVEIVGGSTVSTAAGNLTLDGSMFFDDGVFLGRGDGVHVDASTVQTTGGALSMTGAGGTNGVSIANGSQIASGAGALTLAGTLVPADANTGAGVSLTTSTLAATGGAITITGGEESALTPLDGVFASGARITNTGAGTLAVDGLGSQAGVVALSSTISAGTGATTVTGRTDGTQDFGEGVLLASSTLQSQGGGIAVTGTGFDAGVELSDATVSSGAGDLAITGSLAGATASGTGIDVLASTVSTTTGALTLDGSGSTGIHVHNAATIASTGGSISMIGGMSGDLASMSAGILIDAGGRVVNTGAGGIALAGTGVGAGVMIQGTGVPTDPPTIALESGALDVHGDMYAVGGVNQGTGDGVRIDDATLRTTSGTLTLTGTGYLTGVSVRDNGLLSSDSGSIAVTGGLVSASVAGVGVSVDHSSVTTGGGIALTGTGLAAGVSVTSASLSSGAGDTTLTGTGAATLPSGAQGQGIDILASDVETTTGALRLTGNGGIGVHVEDESTLSSQGGAIAIAGGTSAAPAVADGVSIEASDVTNSDSGSITVTGFGLDTGVHFGAASLTTASGAIAVDGTGGSTGTRIENESELTTDTGAVGLSGRLSSDATFGDGLVLSQSSVTTGSGAISITGLGLSDSNSGCCDETDAHGVEISDSAITSTSGAMDIRGGVQATAGSDNTQTFSTGALIDSSTLATSGAVRIAGSTSDGGPGIDLGGFDEPAGSLSAGQVTLLASAGLPDADAIVISSPVTSTGITDLRPGAVTATGEVVDLSSTITVGADTGFGLSAGDLSHIAASTLVIGSDSYGGAIQVVDGTVTDGNLTLQTGAGGSIAIDAGLDVGTHTLALVTGGSVTQQGAIGAGQLLVRAGSATLTNADNRVDTFAAVAGAGPFDFVDGKALTLGPVAAEGIGAAGDTRLALDARSLDGSAMAPGLVMTVRNLGGGDLTLDGDVHATAVDLVTDGTFQNTNSTMTASDRWRVYAPTWVDESRGGVAGSGDLPNLYGCAYGGTGSCGVDGNEFIYRDRPTLTVTIDDKTRLYGDANPVFTYGTSGLVNGDSATNAVDGLPSTLATQTSAIGGYLIDGTHLFSRAGYVLAITDGTLTIAPRPVTITANDAARLYGNANPAFGASASGLASFDSIDGFGLGFSTPATDRSNVGAYAIHPEVGNPGFARNYAVTLVDGALTVDARPVTITAGDAARLYGDANPAFGASASGLAYFDSIAGFGLGFSTPATDHSNVGAYAIHPDVGNTGFASNYAVTLVDGHLGVTPRPLTLTAADASRVYGDANPALDGTAAGLASFDTAAGLGLGFATAANAGSNVGHYAITPFLGNGAAAANYAVTPVDGTLAVTPATLVYTATPMTVRELLGLPASLDGAVSGLRNGDTLAGATSGSLAWTTPVRGRVAPGIYAIDGSGLSAANYVFVQAAGNATALTVTPLPTELVAQSQPVDMLRQDLLAGVYDMKLGATRSCLPDSPLDRAAQQAAEPDILSIDWSRLRSKPRISTCIDSGRQNGCGDF